MSELRIGIRVRLARVQRSQGWLAREIGMHPTLLSRVLRGLRRKPGDFDARVDAALRREEAPPEGERSC